MDRRAFISRLGGVAALVGVGSLTTFGIKAYEAEKLPNLLKAQLADLADSRFAGYASAHQPRELLLSLMDKGVITAEGGVDHERALALAQEDPITNYQGFYYTQTELELYAVAFMVSLGQGSVTAVSAGE